MESFISRLVWEEAFGILYFQNPVTSRRENEELRQQFPQRSTPNGTLTMLSVTHRQKVVRKKVNAPYLNSSYLSVEHAF